ADAALDAAFDLIGRQIAAWEDGAGSSAISDAASSTATERQETASAAGATAQPSEMAIEVTEGRETIAATPAMVAGDAEAQDEAVLDLIALEMAAADFSEHQPDECISEPDPVLP